MNSKSGTVAAAIESVGELCTWDRLLVEGVSQYVLGRTEKACTVFRALLFFLSYLVKATDVSLTSKTTPLTVLKLRLGDRLAERGARARRRGVVVAVCQFFADCDCEADQ